MQAMHLRHERRKALAVNRLRRRHCHGAVCAPVEATLHMAAMDVFMTGFCEATQSAKRRMTSVDMQRTAAVAELDRVDRRRHGQAR